MRSGKKITTVMLPTLLCVFGILLTACGGGSVPGGSGSTSTTKAADSQQVYRWAFRLPDINSFDPGIATDNTSIQAINLTFTGLVQLDDQLNIKPQLAESYDVSKDGMTYTFHLRPNLKFSDGKTLDANDVAYSIDRALSPAINNQSGVATTYLGLIKGATERTQGKLKSVIGSGVIVKDPNTVVFKLTKSTAYFLGALTYPTSFVVEKSVIDAYGSKWTDHLSDNGGQGGDGPFKVKSYSHTTGIQFVPNDNYYGPKPQLKEIDYLPYKDRDTSYNAYLANQVDITDVPLAQTVSAKSRSDYSQNDALTLFYIGMNYKVKPLDNINIRQALALALDRDTIVKAAWHNAYTPTCHIIPKGQYGYDANLTCPAGTDIHGDKAKAVALFNKGLQEEGLTRQTFPQITFTYPTQSPEGANEVATEVQMWKSVLGINIATTAISQNSLYTAQAQTQGNTGPLQMWTAGWGADFPDPEDWISLQFGTNAPNNAYNYGDNKGSTVSAQQALQKQMAAADVINNKAARLQAYNKIEQQLVNDVAWLPIYQRPDIRLLKPYVIGLKFNAASMVPPNDWANTYIAQH
ncbi:peptide ABC transporter substrate-binding protein [Dictyobacter arantiisoli]|uniref:Peptide ABC transporter substrate-binding protein n=1 Tax=Dictyobacter arantiisoli TaxID=2014874 RepID=A0A5A5TLB2_9CHLR|nr:peptide ABC transporter substrate-binding protein [Dictyobacter arantiisoli]GCF11909.1 peptide ABC transporter substrate-binding protein [Dictyobacter arantiisoli]